MPSNLNDEADATEALFTAFSQGNEYFGRWSQQASVRVTQYLLGRIALDPRDLHEAYRALLGGTVYLRYFGVANPVPIFKLPMDSVDLPGLQAAIDANANSRMVSAALRCLHWREAARVGKRTRWHQSLMEEFVRDHPRPDYRRPLAFEAWKREFDARAKQLRESRQARLARLDDACAPGLTGWQDLKRDVALHALLPLIEEHAEQQDERGGTPERQRAAG